MYQALVRLPSQLQPGTAAEAPHARFDWGAFGRALMRLFSRPRR